MKKCNDGNEWKFSGENRCRKNMSFYSKDVWSSFVIKNSLGFTDNISITKDASVINNLAYFFKG
jgi:hypothetical protein